MSGTQSRRPIGPIRVLGEHIANQIAAGEVVERPASVVKELIENALDAGARRIDVEIKAGGKEYIRVTDDGSGIAPSQLPLAFERHATSKIATAHDLYDVATLGFRGEALPSIAAVAEVTVRSRTEDSPGGFQYVVVGGRPGAVEPVGAPVGTTVIVGRLFFNTPARYRFLRTDGAEGRRVADVVARMALAWPRVALRLTTDGRELLATPGDGQLASVIGALYGPATRRALVPVDFEQDGLRVGGFVGKPDVLHGNRDRMSLFLNGRWIQSPSLLHAVQRGYETLLPPRRFPLAILHLTIDPRAVDVNVHPTKAEVRFQDDSAAYRAVLRAVRYSLADANLVGALPLPPEQPTTAGVAGGEDRAYVPGAPDGAPRAAENFGDLFSRRAARPLSGPRHDGMYAQAYEKAAGRDADGETVSAEETDVDHGQPATGARHRLREMTVIGQLHRTFILGDTGDGLWIVDQHVAHERVLYERFLHADAPPAESQTMLTPLVLSLSPERLGLVEQFRAELDRLGFHLEPFGPGAYAVRGIPVALRPIRDEQQLTALLENILDACVIDGRWNDHGAAAALACQAAVKAGDVLTKEQMEQLLAQLAEADNPFACPHGRPIVVEVSRLDLERRFGRR